MEAQSPALEYLKGEQAAPLFLPLDRETRATVNTAAAAHHLSRRPQTLRCWATYGTGPLTPLRVHGRLAWKTEDLRRLLGVPA